MERHPPAYLSPSRLSAYDYCPAEFQKRYILKQPDPPTPEMAFGTAVHAGIEAHFLGKDDELAFLKSWREAQKTIAPSLQPFGANLPVSVTLNTTNHPRNAPNDPAGTPVIPAKSLRVEAIAP